jgi:hypothetical protein
MTIVNIYCQSDEKDELNNLLGWSVPEHCLVAGNSNTRHHTWQAGQTTDRAKDIAGWASENGLDLRNTPDAPTSPHGNAIYLDCTNIPVGRSHD